MTNETNLANGGAMTPASVPAQIGPDPYTSYAAKAIQQQGLFLTFKNGEFLAGQDGTEVKIGTRLAANMEGLMIGWRRWFGGQVTDDLLELLSDQKPLPRRESLGDNDPALWEKDDRSGAPRDPWMFTNSLQMVDNAGEIYIYSTGSKGGLNAIGKLCKAYGLEYRMRPGMIPVIELANDFYMHAKYGKTYVPVFNLVGWTKADKLSLGDAAEPASKKTGVGYAARDARLNAPAPATTEMSRDLDDEIPF